MINTVIYSFYNYKLKMESKLQPSVTKSFISDESRFKPNYIQYRHRWLIMGKHFLEGFQLGATFILPYAFVKSTSSRNFKIMLQYPLAGGSILGAYFFWTCLFRHEI